LVVIIRNLDVTSICALGAIGAYLILGKSSPVLIRLW